MDAAWRSGFFEQLSKELKAEFPDMKGFSATNLKYCKRFYEFYTQDNVILQQVIAESEFPIRQQLADELETHLIFQIP